MISGVISKKQYQKLSLSFEFSIKDPFEFEKNSKDPIFKLISNYEEIKIILNTKSKSNISKYLYFNKGIIHAILYNSEEIMDVNFEDDFAFYFYLNLLIKDNENLTNYTYLIEPIQNINEKNKANSPIKKILLSKIIIEFIQNLIRADTSIKVDNELQQILSENYEIIEKNIHILSELNNNLTKDNIKTKKIDEIYINIIKGLIKDIQKFSDFNCVYSIIDQLDLLNINITQLMFENISNILNDKNIKAYYFISNINDLLNITKINFYFILLKYIFKNQIYIYQIPFLLNTRKTIIKIIKSNLEQLLSLDIDDSIGEKLDYIIEEITGLDFYFRKYLKYKLYEVLNYYNNFFPEKNEKDIYLLKQIIENNAKIKYEHYLNEYNKAKKRNKRKAIINEIYNKKIKKDKNVKKENELLQCIEMWENCEEKIKKNEINRISKEELLIILEYFNSQKYKNLLLKIFSQNEYDLFQKSIPKIEIEKEGKKKIILNNDNNKSNIINKNEPKKNTENFIFQAINSEDEENIDENNGSTKSIISCSDYNTEAINNNSNSFIIRFSNKEEDYENLNNNDNGQKFELNNHRNLEENNNNISEDSNNNQYDIIYAELSESNIMSSKSENISSSIINQNHDSSFNSSYKKNEIEIIEKENKNKHEESKTNDSIKIKYIEKNMTKNNIKFKEKGNKYKILELCEILGNHKNNSIFIKELNNGYFISGGKDNKIIFYDQDFNIRLVIINLKDLIDIYEQKIPGKNTEEIRIIIFCKNMAFLVIINNIKDKYSSKIFQYDELKDIITYIEMKSKIIICSKNGLYQCLNPFNSASIFKENNLIEKSIYCGGIQLNDNIAVISSNRIIPGGEDKLIFLNVNTKELFYEIKGYSFIISTNGLTLFQNVINNNKIILCACKKYLPNQKNGILLVVKDIGEGYGKIFNNFYNTGKFEVYCFCPLFDFDNHKPTNYFLVGGFEQNKYKGVIKLFKITLNKNVEIEFIQDIIFEKDNKFKGFNKPINCIIQSSITGNIIINCLEGNDYLMSVPNIDYFLLNSSDII